MKVVCFNRVADEDPAVQYECESFTSRTIDPFKHEVILHNLKDGPKEMLLEVDAGERQATGPKRYARIVIGDEKSVLFDKDTSGSAGVSPPVAEAEDETAEDDDTELEEDPQEPDGKASA